MLNRLKTLTKMSNFAAIRTKIKSRKWVKKYESQVDNRDKLKAVVLHDSSKEVHMTQLVRFAVEDSVTDA